MPILKSLSFIALPKPGNDPVQTRRIKFITKLEEQKLLLTDPNHARTVQRWTKVNGERQTTTKQVVMSIKFGAKPIEFERGKAGIIIGSKDKPCEIPVRNVGPEEPLMRPGRAARFPPYASACPRHFPDLLLLDA